MNRRSQADVRRSRRALIFVVVGLALILVLASSSGAWAAAAPGLLRATVPTPTPFGWKPPPGGGGGGKAPGPSRIEPPPPTPCANCLTPVAASAESPVDVGVNAGGDVYTDSTGLVWQTDQEYVKGRSAWGFVRSEYESGTFVGTRPISGTDDAPLYQHERWAMGGYVFEVPNGDYEVSLGFAEQFVQSPGRRVFSVNAQKAPALTHFDIFSQAGGRFIAVDRVITATVTDGSLTIDFVHEVENPSIAAIKLHRIMAPTPTPAATGTPTPTPTKAPTEKPAPTSTPTRSATPTATPSGTPLPAAARVAGLFPQAASALRSANGGVLVSVPAGAVGHGMQLIHVPMDRGAAPSANPGFSIGGAVFGLQTADTAGTFIKGTLLLQPMTITVRFADDDWQAASKDRSRLVLGMYRPDSNQWMALETLVDPLAGTATARSRRPGLFALMIRGRP